MVLLAAGLVYGVDWAVLAVERSRFLSFAYYIALVPVLGATVVDSRIEVALVDVLLAPGEPDV